MLPRPIYTVNLGAEAVAASTPYVLVDLSDVTNFPHTKVQQLHLLSLIFDSEKMSGGAFDVWIGVVTENDGTDGSVTWLQSFHLESTSNPTDSTDRFHAQIDYSLAGENPDGLNCSVVSGATPFFAGNQVQADNVNWQNDVNRTSPVGTTTKVGVGDLVAWVEEVTDGGTLDFSLTALYSVG